MKYNKVGKENMKSKVERVISSKPQKMFEILDTYKKVYRRKNIDRQALRDSVRELAKEGRINRDWTEYGDPIYTK